MAEQPKVFLLDVTNRDGVQTSRIKLSKLQKTILNLYLDKLGVWQSEAGFPFTPHEAHYLDANVELAQKGVIKRMRVSGWCRALKADVEATVKLTKVKHLNISLSTSVQMTTGKFGDRLGRRRGEGTHGNLMDQMTEALDYALDHGIQTVGVNAEDASRTELEYLLDFAGEAKAHGACRFRYCDTLGYDSPFSIHDRFYQIAKAIQIPLEAHCHNDLGQVVANSVAAALGTIEAGVDCYINTTMNGIGERAGNCDLGSVALALKYSAGVKDKNLLDPAVDLTHLYHAAMYTFHAFKIPVPPYQVAVGANAFAHESGIHADGTLKDRRNYELYDFEEVGRGYIDHQDTGRIITTGEYGGGAGLVKAYQDIGIELKPDQIPWLLNLAQHANINTQQPLTEEEMLFIYEHPEEAKKLLTVTP